MVVTRPSAESKSENSRNQFPCVRLQPVRTLPPLSPSRHLLTLTSHLPRPLISLISHLCRPPCTLSETGDEDEDATCWWLQPRHQMSVAGGGSGDPVLGSFHHRHQQPTFTVSQHNIYTLDNVCTLNNYTYTRLYLHTPYRQPPPLPTLSSSAQ